jgi:16S rRNA (cytosine1407-C5)-methyltransferase
LYSYLKSFLADELDSFTAAAPESTAIRVNTLKTSGNKFIEFLNKHQVKFDKIAFNPDGLIIREDHLPLSHSLAFFTGQFQYQGISSQVPVLLLDPRPEERILDMAAAPGSKAAQIGALMKNRGMLVLNDNSHNRLQALNTNIQRSGVTNSVALNMRGERIGRLLPEYFDKVLVDAPCTALGTLAEHPEVAGWWSRDKLDKLTAIQYYLLVSAVKAVRPGGIIVYSTCSVAPEENELLVSRILEKYPLEILEAPESIRQMFDHGITILKGGKIHREIASGIRIWPQRHGMEGFFSIILRKTGGTSVYYAQDPPCTRELHPHSHPEIVPVLANMSDLWGIEESVWHKYRYYLTKDRIWMVSADIPEIPVTPFVSAGLLLAEKRLTGWKTANGSVQVLAGRISKRKTGLTDTQLKDIFQNGEIATNRDDGYYILTVHDNPVATVYVQDGKMRIRLPHRFRLVV